MLIRLLGILMVVGVLVGCGGVSPTDIDNLKEENNQLRDDISDISSKLDSLSQEDREEFLIFRGTWEDGSVKEEYQYYTHPENNKRIKDGWYKSYYVNGGYKEVGTYKDNNRVDEWSHFTKDGEETKGIYTDEKKVSGKFWINVKHDDSSGRFWIETEDVLWENSDMTSLIIVMFIDDINNVYRGLFTYEGGLWNGLGVLYWKNGNKRGEGLYKDGKHEGLYKRYYVSGRVAWEGNYSGDKLEGERVFYWENGNVRLIENYVNDKKEGKVVSYSREGNITDEECYEMDEEVDCP